MDSVITLDNNVLLSADSVYCPMVASNAPNNSISIPSSSAKTIQNLGEIPNAGTYLITVSTNWTANSTGDRKIMLYLGAGYIGEENLDTWYNRRGRAITNAAATAGTTMQVLTTVIKMVPSSYSFPFNVGITFYQNSGAALNVGYRVDILRIGNVKV